MNSSHELIVGYFRTQNSADQDRLIETVLNHGGMIAESFPAAVVVHWRNFDQNCAIRASLLATLAAIREASLKTSGGIEWHAPSTGGITDRARLAETVRKASQLASLAEGSGKRYLASSHTLARLGAAFQSLEQHESGAAEGIVLPEADLAIRLEAVAHHAGRMFRFARVA